MTLEALHADYVSTSPHADRLRSALLEQLRNLFVANDITLGVPMEGRVKAWGSITEKIERKALSPKAVSDFDDLVGIRVILLFRPDLTQVDTLLRSTFTVHSAEDTLSRLNESQFGYQSRHYVIALPSHWLTIPSLAGLGSLRAEIQVRTLAQHIWAAASHKLQYKHESTVPAPLKRSIHRVSALLETVDLEFERLLGERTTYVKSEIAGLGDDELLNVDVLQSILSDSFPARNKTADDKSADLLRDLFHFKVMTVGALKALIAKHRDNVLAWDAGEVKRRTDAEDYTGTTRERVDSGVFLTQGMARQVLCNEFGQKNVHDWLISIYNSDDADDA